MKTHKIDPTQYFANWAYVVHQALWPALGVSLREYVDRAKTGEMRDRARAAGLPAERISALAVHYLAHAISEPPTYAFQTGDLFHLARDECHCLQVIGKTKECLLETHVTQCGAPTPRHAYHITADDFAKWLKTGIKPPHGRIHRSQSISEILRYSIED